MRIADMSNSVATCEWGRITDDGTVFVRTESGEREIGSWQAGDPTLGLAHYVRRYEDLATEVVLLEQRLASGKGNPQQTVHAAAALRATLPTAAVIGDLADLDTRLAAVIEAAQAKIGEIAAKKSAARNAAKEAKEALVAEAEALVSSTQWKNAGDRFRELATEIKAIPNADRRSDDALWKRYLTARDQFNKTRGSHFAELDKQRATAKQRKQELVIEAQKLADSTEWKSTSTRFKELMAEWKATGRASRDVEEQLWGEFSTAQNAFFARRAEEFSKRDAERARNLEAKEKLLTEAEQIDLDQGAGRAQSQLRAILLRWDEIGHVPREAIQAVETRLQAAEQRIKSAVDSRSRRTDPTRLNRVAQVRAQVEKYETQAAKAHAAGDARRAAEAEANAATWRQWLADAERAVQ